MFIESYRDFGLGCDTEPLLVLIVFSDDSGDMASSSRPKSTQEDGKLSYLKDNREINDTFTENWTSTYTARQEEIRGLKVDNPCLTYMKTYHALLESGGYNLVSFFFFFEFKKKLFSCFDSSICFVTVFLSK